MRKLFGIALVLLAALTSDAHTQSYPSRTITIVVPFPAGGPTDAIARILAERMKGPLGQAVVVENISGAGGSIGVGRVAHATPDGYTLSIGHVQTHVINASTLHLDYDVLNDFDPVSLIADTPIWIVTRKSLPVDDVGEFINWLKANPGKATMGAVGVGGPPDIAAVIFQKRTGTKFQIAPYRGGAPLVQDLLGEHIDFAFGQAAGYLSYVRNQQLKALAVLQAKRWWAEPDVPTLDEVGITGVHASFWHGIWVPKGTPKDAIMKLNAAIREALADSTVEDRFRDIGQEIWPLDQQTPEALAAKQKAEIERWSPIIKEAGIKAE